MKLHRNAALSWRGRRQLAQRVIGEGWTVSAAAEAAGVSVRCARKWANRYRLEGERGLLDRSSTPGRVANRTPGDRIAAIVALRQLRMDGCRDLRDARDAALDRLGTVDPDGDGAARPDRARARPALRARPAGRARARRRQEARPDRGWRRLARSRSQAALQLHLHRQGPATNGARSAGNTRTSRSTTTAAWPMPRCCPTNGRRPPLASYATRSLTSHATGSPSSDC
jgi:leucine-zipper of insertion element IS481